MSANVRHVVRMEEPAVAPALRSVSPLAGGFIALLGTVATALAAGLVANSVFAGIWVAAGAAFGGAAAWLLSKAGSSAARLATGLLARRLQAGLLLGDIEARGRSWFWETDLRGCIRYISPQLAVKIGADPEALVGTPLTDLFTHRGEDSPSTPAEKTIDFHLGGKLAFNEVIVRPVGRDGTWWSVCGCPSFDPGGRFTGFRGTGTDLSEASKSHAEVEHMAKFDALTGLPNRLLMRQTLEQALQKVGGQRPDCALILLDLDRFKNVNDTLGHPVGDVLLQQVAQRLGHVIGDKGRVGRLGGDEFNVVIPDFEERNELIELADAIISRLSLPYVINGSTLSIGASVGIAISPFDGECPDELVRNADLALYAAKAAGKGVHRFYEPEMHADAKDRQLLELDLREALNGNELSLLYQPIVDAVTEEVEGFEALVRWQHPVRGLVSPTEFIPIAEEIGLIPVIGEWVIRTACADAASWPQHLRLAVNLSPLQFASPGLPAIIVNALAAAGLPAERLELELTEGVFLNESAAIDQMFNTLKGVGVRLALDDFGTGYASLSNLKRGAFDKIKIDQSFVRGAWIEGSRNAPIIRAIVAMAGSLGMETTAEGAETIKEVELIRSLGCTQIQGYIFGKPMSASEAYSRAQRSRPVGVEHERVEREPRLAVLRFANLISDGRSYPVRIRNLSTGGAMIEIDEDAGLANTVAIELTDTQTVPAELRWIKGRRFGVAFNEKIDLEAVNYAASVTALRGSERPPGEPQPQPARRSRQKP